MTLDKILPMSDIKKLSESIRTKLEESASVNIKEGMKLSVSLPKGGSYSGCKVKKVKSNPVGGTVVTIDCGGKELELSF